MVHAMTVVGDEYCLLHDDVVALLLQSSMISHSYVVI